MNPQMQFGEVDISQIEFNLRCRDEIPKLLMGLQHIYCTPELRATVFEILKEMIPEGVDPNNGCPGMDLWKVFVLGTVRLRLIGPFSGWIRREMLKSIKRKVHEID